MLAINVWTWCTSSPYRQFIRAWHKHYRLLRQYGYVKSSFARFIESQMNEEWTWHQWYELCNGIVPSLEALLSAIHAPGRTGSWWWQTIMEELVTVTDPTLIECTTRYQYAIIKMHQKTAELSDHRDCYKQITVLDMKIENGRRACKVIHVAPDFYRWWWWLEEAQKAVYSGTLEHFLSLQPHP